MLSTAARIKHVREHLNELLEDSKKSTSNKDFLEGYELGLKLAIADIKVWFREELNQELNQEAA